MRRLILASASPRRRDLLGRMGYAFEVIPAQVEEHAGEGCDPRDLVLRNAALKADWVSDRHPDALVLAADTTVFIDGRILNKPGDLEEAAGMLRLLSGRTHTVFTGLVLRCLEADFERRIGVNSGVTFKTLDETAIRLYFERVDPFDKAGAYGIQEARELIIESFTGSFTNIMGLPVEETRRALDHLFAQPRE